MAGTSVPRERRLIERDAAEETNVEQLWARASAALTRILIDALARQQELAGGRVRRHRRTAGHLEAGEEGTWQTGEIVETRRALLGGAGLGGTGVGSSPASIIIAHVAGASKREEKA